jgi:uncharacterized membrane protein YcaP (DUF421 family)
MESVIKGAVVYFFVWLIFRLAGKRSLAEITTFDFVLLLIISETTQSALMDRDNSMTNSILLIVTMVGMDILLSLWKQRSPRVEMIIDGLPLVVLVDGAPLRERMKKARVDEGDILAAARQLRGLERLDQIKYAVLERNGGISIIPRRSPEDRAEGLFPATA